MNNNITLFDEAKKSKVLLNGIVITIIAFLLLVIGQILASVFAAIFSMFKYGPEYVIDNYVEISTGLLGLILSFIFPTLLVFLWVKVVEKRKISSLGLKKEGSSINFFRGFAIGILLFSLVTLVMYLFGLITLTQGISIGIKSIPGILIILPIWIIQSSAEEIMSRGWLMHVVGAKHNPIVGFILSSVFFGFLHILNPGVGFLSIFNIILVGFMFGLYVIYTQDLWGACGIHAAWNFAQANIFGFNVSGMGVDTGSLIKFSSNSKYTGGMFGPEASIFTTVVIALAIIILLFKLRNNKWYRKVKPSENIGITEVSVDETS